MPPTSRPKAATARESAAANSGEVDKLQRYRDAFNIFDKDGSGALSVSEIKAVLTRPGGGAPISDAEAEALIADFDTNGDGELQFEEFAVMWGCSPEDLEQQPAEGNSSVSEQEEPKGGGGKKKKKPLKTVAQLTELLTEAEAELAAHDKASEPPSFERRLGEALQKKQSNLSRRLSKKEAVNEIMKSWDKNGDGEISRAEFRLAVNDKKGLNVQGSAAEIDALFDSFDTDKGGTLDLQELKPCLQLLQDAVGKSLGAELQASIALNVWRARVSSLAAAKATMEELDAAQDALAKFRSDAHVSVVLGMELKERNLTAQAFNDRTIGNQQSMVDLSKFLAGIEKVGVLKNSAKKDIETWFEEEFMMAHASATNGVPLKLGSLNLVNMLQSAIMRTAEHTKHERKLQEEIKNLTKTARRQQAAIEAREEKERAKAQRAAELREAAEAEAEMKEREVKEAKRRAKLQREAKESEEKRAFEERVRKRQAAKTTQSVGVELEEVTV